ncbi:MAG TPA: hypothetical protein VHD84_03265 [Candidatus Saccharimonadales bacterium]|nr:hypothetical protein [Candidatus Saccharimonadales bacterium]
MKHKTHHETLLEIPDTAEELIAKIDAAQTGHTDDATEDYRNPLINEPGLSYEHNLHASNLRREYMGAVAGAEEHRDRWDDHHNRLGSRITVGDVVMEAGQKIADHRKAHKALREAAAHYHRNEGDYQVEAVKMADAEGYHTNFGK